MVSIKKRLIALLMTLVMALGLSVSAFAAEPVDVTAEPTAAASEEASTRESLGDIIAAGATTIYGGSGTLAVTLPSGNFWADIVAQIGYADRVSNVTVTVLTPDGDVLSLGTIAGNGSCTTPYEVFYASAGTYYFYFASAIGTPYEVAAYIYD